MIHLVAEFQLRKVELIICRAEEKSIYTSFLVITCPVFTGRPTKTKSSNHQIASLSNQSPAFHAKKHVSHDK